MIDLHCHSHFSDGHLSVDALFAKAQENGVKILALTDHDSIDGVLAIRKLAENSDLTIINGIELSTRWKKHDIHIVGLQVDIHSDVLHKLIEVQKEKRTERAYSIGMLLEKIGIENAYQKAHEIAGHTSVGRPHFAKLLINEGFAKDFEQAFKRFLGRGRKAYVPTPWISVEEAVAGIIAAGGQAVLAHPFKYGLTRTKLNELIQCFKSAGGVGIEVVSGQMRGDQIKEVAGLCSLYELFASTGSDFHGEVISPVSLGRQSPLPLNCIPIWQQWPE